MGPFAASRGADRSGSAHIPDNDLGFEQPVDFGGSDEAARDMPSIERRRAANRDCSRRCGAVISATVTTL
jgi:hypothetical protein